MTFCYILCVRFIGHMLGCEWRCVATVKYKQSARSGAHPAHSAPAVLPYTHDMHTTCIHHTHDIHTPYAQRTHSLHTKPRRDRRSRSKRSLRALTDTVNHCTAPKRHNVVHSPLEIALKQPKHNLEQPINLRVVCIGIE